MASDCEMSDLVQDPASKPVSSPLLNHNGNIVNIIHVDDNKLVTSSTTTATFNAPSPGSDAPVNGKDDTKNVNNIKNSTKSKDKPASASTVKPRSTKPPRSPSPSPPPIPSRPPLQTLRLEIELGGPDNYEVNLAALAKVTGQRPPTPIPVKRDTSDSEGEGDGEDESKGNQKDKKKRRKNVTAEYYDTSDPFIDDSELPMDERTFFAQTKQKGFYVSSGEVALLKDKTPKKPKSKKVALGPASRIISNGAAAQPKSEGPRDSPTHVGSENEDDKKRKSSDDHGDGNKKRKTTEVRPFHAELEAAFEGLRVEIAKESWVKGKFPPSLKPLLAQVALKAVVLGEYDENFFNYMPKLFPYNKYTMSKLIKRTIWKEHMAILTDRQRELLEELTELTKEGFPKAQEEWEKSVSAWEKKQEKIKAESVEADSTSGDASAGGPAQQPVVDDTAASGTEQDAAPKSSAAKESHPPAKKYRMTEPIKNITWQLVCLSNECCRIENERNVLEGTGQTVSEQGVRKGLYQKILHAFPEGWISSGQISREVSSMKKKFEKESMVED